MAGLIEDDEQPQQIAESTDSSDPFGGDSQRFTWDRDVQIGQLQVELDESAAQGAHVAMIFPRDADGQTVQVDAQNPITVYVTPSSASLTDVRQVLAAHQPDPYFGLSDEDRENVQLREKIASGAELSMAEIQRALQLLV
ncbi:hypothetical protein ACH4S8_37765 [Streptomyces sp. NPDC021080]|uniref:hypothetical protein n=1 Tax=Streptomyces sp. NPDC021080 TaxID=3365110 RepID=UPI00379FEEC5